MLAFLSYQTEERVVAASVASLLESIGVQSFMAHEHIEVSVQWRDEILRQIGQASHRETYTDLSEDLSGTRRSRRSFHDLRDYRDHRALGQLPPR